MTSHLANPDAQKREKSLEEIEQQLADEDLRRAMKTSEGRRHEWRLLQSCGFIATTFNTNALQMAHDEGRRSVAIDRVLWMQRVCPTLYSLMLAEQQQNIANHQAAREQARKAASVTEEDT